MKNEKIILDRIERIKKMRVADRFINSNGESFVMSPMKEKRCYNILVRLYRQLSMQTEFYNKNI